MQTNNSHLSISKKRLTNANSLTKCPKCGKSIKSKNPNLLKFGPDEARTPDLYNAIVALYQLSYGPTIF